MHRSTIRPATAADREPVLEFCAHTWDDGDYIDEVYDGWLADGGLFVGEDETGQPIALMHLMLMPDSGAWLEGLRVAPKVRRHGWGRRMVAFGMRWAHKRGAHSLSLMTSQSNRAMIGLIGQLGFELVLAAQWYRQNRPATSSQTELIIAGPGSIDLESAQLLKAHRGRYARGWSFWKLTPELFAGHLQRGEVVQTIDRQAWAIICPNDVDGPEIAHLEGAEGDLTLLLQGLWNLPALAQAKRVVTLTAVDTAAEQALSAAGFEPWEGMFLLYERSLR
ncbi:MAG: hypothetical protein KatS3mg057_1933 [Herpetosiphonaceae bacterium]|nr:MAG: hypothetical protein KatS3mg057_1933 [Herpetosiphonaceae bacterium]